MAKSRDARAKMIIYIATKILLGRITSSLTGTPPNLHRYDRLGVENMDKPSISTL